MGKFLDKSQLPLNRTTNATALMTAIGAITGAIAGITGDRPVMDWLPVVMMGFAGAIAQWLQGVPTPQTRLIGDILQLDGSKTNAEFIRGIMARVIGAGVVPGLESPVDRVDVGRPRSPQRRGDALDAELLDGLANDGNYGDRGTDNLRSPSIAPPENIRAQAWAAADVARGNVPIEGTNMTRRQFADLSNGGFDDVTQG